MLFPSFCRILQKDGFRLKVSYLSFLKLYPLAKIKTNFIFVFEIYPLYLRHCLDAEANQRALLPQELQWKGFNRKSRSSRLLVKLTLCLSLSHIRKYISHGHEEILSFLQKVHRDELFCSREFLHEVTTSAKSLIFSGSCWLVSEALHVLLLSHSNTPHPSPQKWPATP